MYYPLSQITTNLYTNGGEYVYLNNKQNYTGYYWKTSSGKFFSGKTPQDVPFQQLIPIVKASIELENIKKFFIEFTPEILLNTFGIENEAESYLSLKKLNRNTRILLPYYSLVLPTDQDYQIGEMRRYFCKKINEISYLEINKEVYDKLIKNDSTIAFKYYQPFNIPWQLTGNKEQVFITNKNIVELTIKQQKFPQFDLYLKKDYIKYYQ
jgi:hypothetical protein